MYVDELKVFIVMMLYSDSVRLSEIYEPSRIRGIKIKLACYFTKDE